MMSRLLIYVRKETLDNWVGQINAGWRVRLLPMPDDVRRLIVPDPFIPPESPRTPVVREIAHKECYLKYRYYFHPITGSQTLLIVVETAENPPGEVEYADAVFEDIWRSIRPVAEAGIK